VLKPCLLAANEDCEARVACVSHVVDVPEVEKDEWLRLLWYAPNSLIDD